MEENKTGEENHQEEEENQEKIEISEEKEKTEKIEAEKETHPLTQEKGEETKEESSSTSDVLEDNNKSENQIPSTHPKTPSAEQLIPDNLEQRKQTFKNLLTSWIKDNYDKTLLIVIAIAFIIRFLMFLDVSNQPLWYDAASYLATAKQWGLGLDIRNIWYFRRGFFWPLFGAIFFKIGLGEVSIRFTEVLFSTGIVFVSYFLIKEMFNKKYALAVAISLSVSWILLFFTPRPLTSIPASFFLLISLLFFWKGYIKNQGNKFTYLSSLFFALAILTRMQYLMFLPSFLIIMILKDKLKFLKNKSLWFSLIIFAIILSPHIYLYTQNYGNPVTDILAHYFGIGGISETEAIEKDYSNLFAYFKDLPYVITSNLAVPNYYYFLTRIFFIIFLTGIFFFFIDLILGFDKIFKNPELQTKLFILSWIVISFLALGYITPIVEQRYVIPSLPFLFLIPIIFIFSLESLISENIKLSKKIITILLFILLIILLIPNYSWGKQLTDVKKTSYLEVKQAGLWLKENTPPDSIILSDSEPQIQYYSERSTYILKRNESDFEKQIIELNPDYLMISIYEPYPEWAYSYPDRNSDLLTPIQGFPTNEQANVVIYQFDENTVKFLENPDFRKIANQFGGEAHIITD